MTAHCRVEMIIIRILNFNIIAQRTSVGKSCKIDFLYSVGFQTSIRLNKMDDFLWFPLLLLHYRKAAVL